MKIRNQQIDTLRGIACLLLVAYHTIGYDAYQGLKVEMGFYRDINNLLIYIRMPLFTFLSGIVYAYHPFSGHSATFIKGKSRRLLLPMLIAGTIFALTQHYMPGANSSIENWYLLHIIPVGHFWFIEAIFIIFMLMIPLERSKLLTEKNSFILIFIVATLLFIANINVRYFSISGAIYLFPFFLSGAALQRFSLTTYINKEVTVAIISGVVLTFILLSMGILSFNSKQNVIALILGIATCSSLFLMKLESAILARIGGFSYSIYLYHVFFTAGTRILLQEAGIIDINILFSLALILGIMGPMLIEKIFDGSNLTRRLFLGKSKIPPDIPKPSDSTD